MKQKNFLTRMLLLFALIVGSSSAWATDVTDNLNRELTGVTKNTTNYSSWSGKTSNSDAVYAGNSAGGNDAIQLRSNNSNSGIVSTTSGGTVKKVVVTWNSNTTSGRTLNIYGKSTAYSAASDLYNSSNQGTLIGTIVNGTSTELTVSDEYAYIGIRSASGALYLDEVDITWEVSDPSDTRATTTTTIIVPDIFVTDLAGETNVAAGTLTATVVSGETTLSNPDIEWESTNEDVATINADGDVTLKATGTTTIKAIYAGDTDYKDSEGTYELTVIDNNAPGGQNNPYTVEEALAATPSSGTSANVYIKGIVSKFFGSSTSITGDGVNYRYYISDDGTATNTNQLLVYNGKGLNNVAFSSDDDLLIGDEVMIYGGLTTYQSTKEVAKDNYIVSLKRKEAATITVTNGTEQTVDRTQNVEELTLTAIANSGATVVFTLDNDNTTLTEDTDFGFDNGYLAFYTKKGGTIVVKANAPAAGNYNAAEEVTITITVIGEKEEPTILVADGNVAYGSTFTVDDSMIEGGDITVTSSNEAVATVSGLTITPVAVGTTTITVATAENDTYKAGSETFTLTVTAPVGQTTAATSTTTVFEETFDECNGTGGNDDKWSGSIASSTLTADNSGWDFSNGSGANKCAKFGASSKKGSATTPALGTAGTLSLSFRAAAWDGNSESTTLKLSVSAGTIDTENITLTKGEFNTFTATITNATAETEITFEAANASNNRFFLDDVVVTKAGEPLTATLNGQGYATYCSQYPLDFSDYETAEYSAWQITSIDDNVITFSQIIGSIKGGQGILLKGEAGATVSLTSSDSNTELEDNLLEGTLAPMYVAANEYYGLSGNTFVPVSTGTVPAGKALLPAGLVTARQLTFVFEGEATGIGNLTPTLSEGEGVYYNLAGQRVAQPTKGLYIVNGKKVMFK